MSRRYGYRNNYPIGREHLNRRTTQVPILDTKALDIIARQNGYIKPNECSLLHLTVEDTYYQAPVVSIPSMNNWYSTMEEIRNIIDHDLYILNKITADSSLTVYVWDGASWSQTNDQILIARNTLEQYVVTQHYEASVIISDSGDGSWLKITNDTGSTLPVQLEYIQYSVVVE